VRDPRAVAFFGHTQSAGVQLLQDFVERLRQRRVDIGRRDVGTALEGLFDAALERVRCDRVHRASMICAI